MSSTVKQTKELVLLYNARILLRIVHDLFLCVSLLLLVERLVSTLRALPELRLKNTALCRRQDYTTYEYA